MNALGRHEVLASLIVMDHVESDMLDWLRQALEKMCMLS